MAGVAYAVMAYLLSIVGVMFVYTFMWDIYAGFWNMCLGYGANSNVFMMFYTVHQYIPIIAFIAMTIGLVAAVRRPTV